MTNFVALFMTAIKQHRYRDNMEEQRERAHGQIKVLFGSELMLNLFIILKAFVCVCVCVHACMRACVRACVFQCL